MEFTHDVGDHEGTGEGPDEGGANRHPGNVQDAAAHDGLVSTGVGTTSDLLLVRRRKGSGGRILGGERRRRILWGGKGVDDKVEVLVRAGAKPTVNDPGESRPAKQATGRTVMKSGESDDRFVSVGVGMNNGVEVFVEPALDDAGTKSD